MKAVDNDHLEMTEDEQDQFLRMIDYFIKAEQNEIKELNLPGGNKDFIKSCENRLNIFNEIKRKVRGKFKF